MDKKKERFLSKVFKASDEECWQWRGYVHKKSGTGRFLYGRKQYSIARFCFENFIGDIFDEDLIVRQTCGNKLCCNPKHLTLDKWSELSHVLNATKKTCINGHDISEGSQNLFYYHYNGKKYRRCGACRDLQNKKMYDKVRTGTKGGKPPLNTKNKCVNGHSTKKHCKLYGDGKYRCTKCLQIRNHKNHLKYRPKKGPRTHCKNGHGFTQSNTGIDSSGYRYCKKCKKITIAKQRANMALHRKI